MVTLSQVREELQLCKRPLFLFDDDADGLASFLLLYKHINEGKGMPVKHAGGVDETFLRKVKEYEPDKVFILDIPNVSQGFLDEVKVPVIWIDHHPPQKRSKVIYYNPLLEDPDTHKPTSWICYEIVKENLWIAMTGINGDWTFPEKLASQFRQEFAELLPEEVSSPDEALFTTQVGLLAKIFNFVLKGNQSSFRKCIAVLTRINDPYEILNRTTPQGTFIYKKFEEMNKTYTDLWESAKKNVDESLIVFSYKGELSFTSELSNELLFRNPGKVIIVAREKSGHMRSSLRSPKGISIRDALNKIMPVFNARGGGHENACGTSIEVVVWQDFISEMKRELNL